MDFAPGQTVLHYRLDEKIGEGGMGVVWKASDTRLRRDVAIKFLPAEFAGDRDRLARFEREAHALAALNHPGIVTIHAVEHVDDQPFLVMELVRGRPLGDLIPASGLPAEQLLDLSVALTDAINAAHREGITHRDLKPGNVVLGDDGRLKVLDFGLAKAVAPAETTGDADRTRTQAATAAGVVLGTVAYMSPEQAEGRPVDARSDIFSLGVLIYEMATGRKPFGGASAVAVLSSVLRDEPPSLETTRPNLPHELGRIVGQCLAKDPAQRFPSAGELRNRLQALRDETRLGASAVSTPARSRDNTRRIALLGALIAALIATWMILGRRDDRAAPADTADAAAPFVTRTLSQLSFGTELEQWPAWSPDGEQLVYCAEHEGFAKLFLRELRTGDVRQLTRGERDDLQPAWSSDGGTIAFVRSSAERGNLEPSEVLSGLFLEGDVWLLDLASGAASKVIEAAYNPAFSPDGTRIAVDASWAGPRRIWTTDTRGHNPRQITTDTSEAVQHTLPSWSPDSTSLAFQHQEKTKFDIWVVELATNETTAITDDLYRDYDPAWAPSGGHVYFSSYRGGGLNIWRIAVTAAGRPTGPPEQLTTGAGQDIHLSLAPDGQRLSFTVLSQNADLALLPVDPSSGEPTGPPEPLVASTREDSRGAWSPDGTRLAFNSDRDGEMNIWVQLLQDGTTRPVTRGPGGDYQPSWSPDGRSIAFFSARAGNADVWVVDVDSGELRQITRHAALDTNPFFSPDGAQIAFQSDRDGRKEVWLVNADGTGARQLGRVGASDHFMRWSDDGRSIYFRSTALPRDSVCRLAVESGEAEPLGIPVGWHLSFSPDRRLILDAVGHKAMWVYPVDGSEPRKVFAFEDPDTRMDYPEWSPDGRWIVFDRVTPKGGDIWLLEGLR